MILAIAVRGQPEREEEILVGLAEIQDQSIGLAFASNDKATVLHSYQELLSALSNRVFRSLPAQTLDGLRTLTEFSRQRRCTTQFWNGTQAGPVLELDSDFVLDLPRPEYVRGETTLYGKVERVGGVRPRVKLRLSTREVMYGDISEDQARELGKRMYLPAGLRGQATWDPQDGSVVYFRVEEILPYVGGGVRAGFDELNTATRGAYNQVEDVDQLALRIREGDWP